MAHPIEQLIALADAAIVREDLDALLEMYADDAVLVVKPGLQVAGKAAIRKAFEAIAAYFEHSVQVRQAGLVVLESGDTALVLARTVVSASNLAEVTRHATYVFRKDAGGRWRCAIDNSYGHELLAAERAPGAGD
ncbi:MAG TPA: SgcJ/EcaC family oxidoreductase [Anaeromyxobacteraceae bacterium]|nr:SgcJ/EcaC family oxidoreductase [Anaeromyxobacteraceae bacterium]